MRMILQGWQAAVRLLSEPSDDQFLAGLGWGSGWAAAMFVSRRVSAAPGCTQTASTGSAEWTAAQTLQGQALSMQVILVLSLLACGISIMLDRRDLALSLCSF